MAAQIAIRDAFGEALLKLGDVNDSVIALEADVGSSTKSLVFGKAYPERYYNVGISELNMVAMSAGFAREGKIPFVNTFGVFLAARGGDPIQSLIAYDKLNVKLCGTYVGLSDSYDGASHHSITDMSYIRAIPNMTVINFADAVATEKLVFAAAEYEGPVYMRISRAPAPVVHNTDTEFTIGKGIVVKEGTDITLISTGTILGNTLEAARLLEAQGIHAAVIDMHTVQPIDKELVIKMAEQTGAIVTVEEHSIYGGLYSAVAEVTAKNCPVPMGGIGAVDFAESGDYQALLKKYGYDHIAIADTCRRLLERIR
ncbi:MAG: transketolase family protein [Lachnospiraceae bacterium]